MPAITIERDDVDANDGLVEIDAVMPTFALGRIDTEFVMNDQTYVMRREFGTNRVRLVKLSPDGEIVAEYTIVADGDSPAQWRCSCPDYRYRCSPRDPDKRRCCKHCLAAFHARLMAKR